MLQSKFFDMVQIVVVVQLMHFGLLKAAEKAFVRLFEVVFDTIVDVRCSSGFVGKSVLRDRWLI